MVPECLCHKSYGLALLLALFELNYSVGLNVISFLDGRVIMEVEFKIFHQSTNHREVTTDRY